MTILSFPGVLLGVEHLVLDAVLFEEATDQFALLDRDRSDEDRLTSVVPLDQLGHECIELRLFCLVDEIGFVGAGERTVCRDRHYIHAVGVREFCGLGRGRARHATQLLVQTEVVLERDGGEGLVLLFDLHALFCLDA